MPVPVRRTHTPIERQSRWDPFGELEDLHMRMAQILDGVAFGGLTDGAPWSPTVDIGD
jgi:hypothetical protein